MENFVLILRGLILERVTQFIMLHKPLRRGVALLSHIVFFPLGVIFGFVYNSDLSSVPGIMFVPVRRHLNSIDNFSLLELSENQYACNAQRAFEELTALHIRAQKLSQHDTAGDANLSRIRTISRKAGQAQAAEHSFRQCMSSMMPELLLEWDKQAKNEIKKEWNEKSEQALGEDGITFNTLEASADLLE